MTTPPRDECDLHRDRELPPDPLDSTVPFPGAEPSAESRRPDDEWLPPIPFDDRCAVPFPVEVLPALIRDWALPVAEALQVPVDFPAMLALGLVASAGAGRVRVRIEPKHMEPLNLYVVIVGPPSSRKSPTFLLAQAPLVDHDRVLRERAKPQLRDAAVTRRLKEKRMAEAERRAATMKDELERRAADSDARSLARDLDELTIPPEPRLWEGNVTPEALASALAEQGGRIVALSAEGHDFIETACGMRYSDDPNLEVVLKAWSGDGIRIRRKGRPDEDIPSPALTIVVGVQPTVIEGLLKRPGVRKRGLPARFLFSMPQTNQGLRKPLGRRVALDEDIQHRYVVNMRELFEGMDALAARGPHFLDLSPEAFDLLADFDASSERRLHPETGDLAWIDDWTGKWTGTVARLAGVLHIAEDPTDRAPHTRLITGSTMERAAELGRYLVDHASLAYGLMGANPAIEVARRIVACMKRHPCAFISRSELYQALRRRGGVGKPRDLDEPLGLVEEHGYAQLVPLAGREGRPGRPPSPVYEISPWIQSAVTRPNKPRNGSGGVDC